MIAAVYTLYDMYRQNLISWAVWLFAETHLCQFDLGPGGPGSPRPTCGDRVEVEYEASDDPMAAESLLWDRTWSSTHSTWHVGLSENRVYSQWNSHLIGIMISKTSGFRGLAYFQTHPYTVYYGSLRKFDWPLCSFQGQLVHWNLAVRPALRYFRFHSVMILWIFINLPLQLPQLTILINFASRGRRWCCECQVRCYPSWFCSFAFYLATITSLDWPWQHAMAAFVVGVKQIVPATRLILLVLSRLLLWPVQEPQIRSNCTVTCAACQWSIIDQ